MTRSVVRSDVTLDNTVEALDITELFGRGRKGRATVAVKYRGSAEPGEKHLDWSRTDAALDGSSDQGREG